MPSPRGRDLALLILIGLAPGALAQDTATKPEAAKSEAAKPEAAAAAEPKPDVTPAEAAAKAMEEALKQIKEEGTDRSQLAKTLSHLTDVIGPRLTASPGMRRANEWTRDTLTGWGLENAHLESWGPFGRGWTLKRFSFQAVEPQCIPLIGFPKAWSPGTDGPVTGPVVKFEATKEEDLEKYKGKLKGAIVLIGAVRTPKALFEPPGERFSDTKLLDMANSASPARRGVRPARPNRPNAPGAPGANANGPNPMSFLQARNQFLIDEGAAVLVEPSFRGDGGTLFVGGASVPSAPGKRARAWDPDAPKILPQMVLASEHFNRLVRMVEAGEPVKATVDLAVEFHGDDLMGYNTVAEIPGTDLKDEVVMLGGHLDSWHSGTGATDNGAGVSVGMEAVRILKALGIKPRRTIRLALWSGEEQGLFGSRAYVKQHFGGFAEEPGQETNVFGGGGNTEDRKLETKPEYDKFSVYFNLDNGSGKIRGVYLEGNEAARPLFRQWLTPFKDQGASTLTISNTGGTDHMSFDAIGLPGFQFIQDPIEYDTRTHHSNMDVYDRIQVEDLKQSAVIMASFIYRAAMSDEPFPRKPRPGASSTPVPAAAAAAGGQ